jgi:hypothetical protein
MKHVTLFTVAVLSLGLAAGCNRGTEYQQNSTTAELETESPSGTIGTEPVNIVGCLTGAGDRYMLTRLEADATGATETYQLLNADEKLHSMVGRQVRVIGVAEPTQVAQTREVTPAQPAGTSGQQTSPSSTEQPRAQVSSQQTTKLAIHTLRVASVEPMSGECATEQPAR